MANLNNVQARAQESRQDMLDRWDREDGKVPASDIKKKAAAQIAEEDLSTAADMAAMQVLLSTMNPSHQAAYNMAHAKDPGMKKVREQFESSEPGSKERISLASMFGDDSVATMEKLYEDFDMESKRQRSRLENDPAEVQKILGKENKTEGGTENAE